MFMRRIILFLLVSSAVCTSAFALPRETNGEDGGTPWVFPYSDVRPNDWYALGIEFTARNGLIDGKTADFFSPGEAITRGVFVTALARYHKVRQGYADTRFVDVVSGGNLAPYVAWAVENGVSRGISESRFAPESPVTREQIAVMLYACVKINGGIPVSRIVNQLPFVDYTWVSEWAREAVAYMSSNGVILGRADSRFDPQGTATRGEAAVMLYRFALITNSNPGDFISPFIPVIIVTANYESLRFYV